MTKGILFAMLMIYPVLITERNIQSANIGFVICAKIVSHWDEHNRGNWSNGVTWRFDSRYDLQNKKLDVTATFVTNPKIYYKLSCSGDMITIDTN